MTKKDSKSRGREVTWAHAARDFLVTAINRGQLPVLGLVLVAIILVVKLPSEEAGSLVERLVHGLEEAHLLGWALELLTILAWFFHAKWMRKGFSEEAARIGREKSDLQNSVSGVDFGSSDKK